MSELTLRRLDPADYERWFSANRDALEGRSPFHEPTWLNAVARGTRFGLGYIGAYEGDEIVAAVPGFLAPRGPIKMFGSPLRGTMTSYLGPVSLDRRVLDDPPSLLVDCADFARREWRAILARFTTRDAPDERVPPVKGWHEQRPRSYRLDLTVGEDALFEGLKSHCRRNVRKAEREGVEIVPLEDATACFAIIQDAFRRHGSASWQQARFFRSLFDSLVPRGLLDPWAALYDGEMIAAGLFFHDEREMHFIAGGSRSDHGSLPTSYLLHWHAIRSAARRGLETFNSEASRIPSIDQFKETFNPTLERRRTLIWARRPIRLAESSLRKWNKQVRSVKNLLPTG